MTNLFDHLTNLAPRTIGFDSLLQDFENLSKVLSSPTSGTGISFPPYDIYRDNDIYILEMALAGFQENDITITLQKDNTLVIKGECSVKERLEQAQQGNDKTLITKGYLYRGIAKRQFEKKFKLSEKVKVKEARFQHGLLTINLQQETPSQSEKVIPINQK
jgi:molecular chaperone IbpA